MILFLDFDGVLHHENVVRIDGKPACKEPGRSLFEWVQPLEDILRDAPHVRVVLSTSWVAILSFNRTKSYLPDAIQKRVIGATYHSGYASEFGITKREWPTLHRFQQIQMYLARNQVHEWVALDDDDEGWPDDRRQHLVCTNSELGLSDPEAVEQLRKSLASFAPVAQEKGSQP